MIMFLNCQNQAAGTSKLLVLSLTERDDRGDDMSTSIIVMVILLKLCRDV